MTDPSQYPPQTQAQPSYRQAYPPQPPTTPYPAYPAPQQVGYAPYAYPQPADSGSFGWAVLGFLLPVVGLILYLVWKDAKPLSARQAGKGALVSVIVSAALLILYIIILIMVMLLAAAGANA